MGIRPHVHIKHEIKYGNEIPNMKYCQKDVYDFFFANNVDVIGGGDYGENPDWEFDREQLEILAKKKMPFRKRWGDVSGKDLRVLVDELLKTKVKGGSVYLSWF